MNLIDYTVLSFEPLHDLKGHIANLLSQLPSVITQPQVKSQVQEYLNNFTKKPKLYGSDYREALIQVMHILVNGKLDTNDPVYVLVGTLVKISEITYSKDSSRTPRQCLQFYNCAFLHHQTYVDLFKVDKRSIYFHAMLMHGPVQHELVCSRSANAEAEEHLFKQAGHAAKNTDHKANGFVEALLVRLQCKQLDSSPVPCSYTQVSNENSRIKKAAKSLPCYPGSHFNKTFVQNHLGEFQSHLQRIAHYLVYGEGVWWHKTDNGTIVFLDSDLDPEYHTDGPSVLHFRSASLKDVSNRADQCWRKILCDKIGLPLTAVRVYGTNGSILNVTEVAQTSMTNSEELLTTDPNESEPMDTTPLIVDDPGHVENNGGDLSSMSTGIMPIPLITSTPQRKQAEATPVEEHDSATVCCENSTESESTAMFSTLLHSYDDPIDESSPITEAQCSLTHASTVQETDHTFQTKLAKALNGAVGYSSELQELDQLRTDHNTNSDEYKALKLFFRKKLAQQCTKIQKEMLALEKSKQKKTEMYRKLSKDLKKATVLLTHIA